MNSKYGFKTISEEQRLQKLTKQMIQRLVEMMDSQITDILEDFSYANGWRNQDTDLPGTIVNKKDGSWFVICDIDRRMFDKLTNGIQTYTEQVELIEIYICYDDLQIGDEDEIETFFRDKLYDLTIRTGGDFFIYNLNTPASENLKMLQEVLENTFGIEVHTI